MNELNQIINIDLHIHSCLSAYKEKQNYVDVSNIKNIGILLKKLDEKNINLFSITDHNRFDFTLYASFKKIISNGKYPNIKKILPGIEFDVQIEAGKEACHIICIFDDSDLSKIQNIEIILNKQLLVNKKNYYRKQDFENTIKEIGLDVVLIAHQHKHFSTPKGGKRSVSNSVSDMYEFIKTGYVNALEYQKPDVQGMIINSLKKTNKNIATIIGSDCHQWDCYPQKDNTSPEVEYVSHIKALPNFSGLKFAMTSVETRFNRVINSNKNYVKSIKCNNKTYELCNGLNAVIGDNGAGKSLLLDIIYSEKLKNNSYKELKKLNILDKELEGVPKIEYIRQNQIIDDVKEGVLFNTYSEEYYKPINSKATFSRRIKKFSDNLIKRIEHNINVKKQEGELSNTELLLKIDLKENHIPIIKNDLKLVDNEITDRLSILDAIYQSLLDEYDDNKKFYNKNAKEINDIIKQFKNLILNLKQREETISKGEELKNLITSHKNDFNNKMDKNRTDKEKEEINYRNDKNSFAKSISNVIKLKNKEPKTPVFPKSISGSSRKLHKGFVFSKQTKYNNQYLEANYFEDLFTKDFNETNILGIDVESDLVAALNGITKYEDIKQWHRKVDGFIEEYSSEETYIERKSTKETMGNTPGEISIVFYDFKFQEENNDVTVILIDQPEDDISNTRISKKLIEYINQIRDKKQIIMVTHNPMLVVNLDVDNVVCVNKNYKKQIFIKNGCLEYENGNYKIIDEIADQMDGGLEVIERRFKLYEN